MTDTETTSQASLLDQKPIVYIVALTAALAGLLFGLDVGVISGALPLVAKEFGAGSVTQEAIVSSLLWGAALGAVMSGFLSRRFGRKSTLVAALLIATLAALLVFIIGFAMSAGPIIWILCAEIFPTQGRDLGITISTTTNWVVNGIVGATFLTLLEKLGNGNTFLLYGGIEVLFILVFIAFVPETKGVSLERIASNLLAGKKLKNIGR